MWFLFVSNLSKNLDNAFKLWDAVGGVLPPACEVADICQIYAGTQAASKEIKDSKIFSDAHDWLHARR